MARAKTKAPAERWKCIKGFPLYMVSDQGRISSFKGANQNSPPRKTPVIMKQRLGKEGYPRVTMQDKEGKKKVVDTHLLVARAFLGRPPSPGLVVRHKDGNPKRPWAINLEYGTQAENSKDRLRHGTDARGERNAQALLTLEDVARIRDLKGKKSQRQIAGLFGISRQAVSDIHRGITWDYDS